MSEITQEEPSSDDASPARDASTQANEDSVAVAVEDASIGRWFVEAARSAILLRPDWHGLRATPLLLAAAFLFSLGLTILQERLYILGGAHFTWRALGYGWVDSAVLAWACWLLLPAPRAHADLSRQAANASTLYTLLFIQAIVMQLVLACIFVPMVRMHVDFSRPGWSTWVPILPLAWFLVAQVRFTWVGAPSASGVRRAGVALLLLAVVVGNGWLLTFSYWQADRPVASERTAAKAASGAASGADEAEESDADSGPDMPMLKLSQDVFEAQQRLLAARLEAIQTERAGTVDVYAITFAPYADVDVFMRESAVVADVMESRFDTRGRTLQLVNNVATVNRFAWATPLNLKRSIDRLAQRMNRDEDILFLHLTSHGGADGHLAAEFFPLTVDELTPQMLRRWLDEAGVRHRVISISACFSGSWVAPLANDDTLVMTAADADHTSYGCGSKSTLTFFGQAMYDEQLRHTWSFEEAHAASRKLIDERERAAGKTDGYSNPQISVGVRIREKLKALEVRLAASAVK